MLNLCLHCGSHHTERRKVELAPTPDHTETWFPIPHSSLLREVETTLAAHGMRVVNESHALWGEGLRYFGLLEVENGHHPDGHGLVLGIRNSHDKSFPASIAVGSGVFVCDNLAFSGEVKIARRHTRFIERDLPGVVGAAIGKLGELRVQQDRRIGAYRGTELSDPIAHDLVVRALDQRVVPASQIPRVLEEWRHPHHPEFTQGGKTAWRLFNAFTEVLKGRNLALLPRRTQCLHGLIDSACCSLSI